MSRSCGPSPTQLPRQMQNLHLCLLISANSPALLSAHNPLTARSVEYCPLEFCKFFLKPCVMTLQNFSAGQPPANSHAWDTVHKDNVHAGFLAVLVLAPALGEGCSWECWGTAQPPLERSEKGEVESRCLGRKKKTSDSENGL